MNNSSFHEHKNHKITKTITNKTNEKNVHTVRFLLMLTCFKSVHNFL